jgi:hypothetical protein
MIAVATVAVPQFHAQRALPNKILTLSDAEQIAFTNSDFDQGMPVSNGNELSYLVRNRSSLILPILEMKIEQVLKSANPRECFSSKDVDPQRFIGLAASLITAAEDEQALIEASKLLKLDEKKFAWMVESTLSSLASGNPFVLAYKGADMEDPALDKGIAAWADAMFRQRSPDHPGSLERRWADVMVDRYGGVPIQSEWASDPIVSRMNPAIVESMRQDMFRFLQVAWEKHPRRLLAMSDADQVALVKSVLDQGIADMGKQQMHEVERHDLFAALARAHSSLVLPIIEAKIEEVYKSSNPSECFTNKSVDPQMFIVMASNVISQAANVEALKQAGKLQKLNKNFDGLIRDTLYWVSTTANAFVVAYQGLGLGDPDVDKKIIAWIEDKLAAPTLNIPKDWRHQWSQAMLDRYGDVPLPAQWAKDPIASRLRPDMSEPLYNEVVRFAKEFSERRTRK